MIVDNWVNEVCCRFCSVDSQGRPCKLRYERLYMARFGDAIPREMWMNGRLKYIPRPSRVCKADLRRADKRSNDEEAVSCQDPLTSEVGIDSTQVIPTDSKRLVMQQLE